MTIFSAAKSIPKKSRWFWTNPKLRSQGQSVICLRHLVRKINFNIFIFYSASIKLFPIWTPVQFFTLLKKLFYSAIFQEVLQSSPLKCIFLFIFYGSLLTLPHITSIPLPMFNVDRIWDYQVQKQYIFNLNIYLYCYVPNVQ